MDHHSHYNRSNFPHFLALSGNWAICADQRGQCAAIAVKPGARSSHFGPLEHAAKALATGRNARAIARRWAVVRRNVERAAAKEAATAEAVAQLRARRAARGMSDPLNRLRAITAAAVAAGAPVVVNIPAVER